MWLGWSRGVSLVIRRAFRFGSLPRRGVSVLARPPVGGFPYSCRGPPLIIRGGRTRCAPVMGQPVLCIPLRDVCSAPRYGASVCAPLEGTSFRRPFMGLPFFVRPFMGRLIQCPFVGQLLRPLKGRLFGAPLWGYRLCAPLWGVFPVPLYGATVDHVSVCALPIGTGLAVGMPPVSRVL